MAVSIPFSSHGKLHVLGVYVLCICAWICFSFFTFNCGSTRNTSSSLEMLSNWPRTKAEKVDIILFYMKCVCVCLYACIGACGGVAKLTVKERSQMERKWFHSISGFMCESVSVRLFCVHVGSSSSVVTKNTKGNKIIK